MTSNWFLFLLASTTLLRGLGAGIILGAELMTLPVRRRLDLTTYARFMRAHYKEPGVKIYAVITILGLLLSLILAVWTLIRGDSTAVSWPILVSFIATVSGFVGTAGAYPSMRKLWSVSDNDTAVIASLLDRFAYWSIWSAVSHIIAFIFLGIALANFSG